MKILHHFPWVLFFWHLLFAFITFNYIQTNSGDAMNYWFIGKDLSKTSWLDYFDAGTDVVKLLTYPLVKYFHLLPLTGYLIFSMLSFPAFVVMYKMLKNAAGTHRHLMLLVYVLMLLPNTHFWTSLIGKEALLLLPLSLFSREIYRGNNYSILLIISVLLIGVIRPHVSFVLVVSYALSLLLTQRFSTRKIGAVLGVTFGTSAVFAVLLLRLQDFSGGLARIAQKYEAHIQHFRNTDGYVPLDEYALPWKIFTFYFRPLPFEKGGLYYTVVSSENLIMLVLMLIAAVFAIRKFSVLKQNMLFVFPLVFLFLFALMYVFAYANYGIIMRTKIMVTPAVYLWIVAVLSARAQQPSVPLAVPAHTGRKLQPLLRARLLKKLK